MSISYADRSHATYGHLPKTQTNIFKEESGECCEQEHGKIKK